MTRVDVLDGHKIRLWEAGTYSKDDSISIMPCPETSNYVPDGLRLSLLTMRERHVNLDLEQLKQLAEYLNDHIRRAEMAPNLVNKTQNLLTIDAESYGVGMSRMSKASPTIELGLYRHNKTGKIVLVKSIVKHTETMKDMVVYIDCQPPFLDWTRPADMWNDIVDGKSRFEKVKV